MPNLINLVGKRFGRLTVVRLHSRGKRPAWTCLCDCGATTIRRRDHLVEGRVLSCGCLHDEGRPIRHGHKRVGMQTSIYLRWSHMIARCSNPNDKSYPDYGGRGIGIDDPRWFRFENFLADMGEPPDGKTLNRIDNDKGYSLGNCEWATPTQQANNRRPRSKRD